MKLISAIVLLSAAADVTGFVVRSPMYQTSTNNISLQQRRELMTRNLSQNNVVEEAQSIAKDEIKTTSSADKEEVMTKDSSDFFFPMDKMDEKAEAAMSTELAVTDNEKSASAEVKELTETEKLLKQIKEAGTAGVVSYALWELAFWLISIPVCIFGYRELTGHWPDFSNQDDLAQVGAEAFAFVNFARFAVPLRIGLALGSTGWVQENIVDRFMKNKKDNNEEIESTDPSA